MMNRNATSNSAQFPIAIQTPAEITTLGLATEILNHVATLEMHCAGLRGAIFGDAESASPRSEPTTLHGVLSAACQNAAMLCGEMATIKQRLGV